MIADSSTSFTVNNETQTPDSDISSLIRQPQSKFLRRLPVTLYRLGLGPIIGIMPLLVMSTRACDGHTLYTPLEYRRHGSRIYVLATSRNARWLQRINDSSGVTIRIGTQNFPAVAQVVTDEGEAVRALFLFRMNAPVPLRWIYWSGRNRNITHPQNFKDASRRYTFVRVERLPASAISVRPVPADYAWLSGVLALLLAAAIFLIRKNMR